MEATENDNEVIDTSESLKTKGNEAVRNQDFKGAIVFYSEAIRRAENLSENGHILYSNRSFAYLKNKEYYYALADAEKCIEMHPGFVKGYYRKAEVLKSVSMFEEAVLNYGKSLKVSKIIYKIIAYEKNILF